MDRLEEILTSMEIPPSRLNDWRWLGRNLGIQNHNHPDFSEALILLREKTSEGFIVGEETK